MSEIGLSIEKLNEVINSNITTEIDNDIITTEIENRNEITIKFFDGKNIKLLLDKENSTIQHLRNKLKEKFNVDKNNVYLYNKELNSDDNIINQNQIIENNSVLFCIISYEYISLEQFLTYYQLILNKNKQTNINEIYQIILNYNNINFEKLTCYCINDSNNTNNIQKIIIENGTNIYLPMNIFNFLNNIKELLIYNIIQLNLELCNDLFSNNTLNTLIIRNCKINYFPKEINNCTNLCTLILVNIGLKEIPEFIYDLNNLKILDMSYNELTNISPKIKELPKITRLNITVNYIKELPKEIFNTPKMIIIKFSDCINSFNNANEFNNITINEELKYYLHENGWEIKYDMNGKITTIKK